MQTAVAQASYTEINQNVLNQAVGVYKATKQEEN